MDNAVEESDHHDYKLLYSRTDPFYKTKLREDCAALASTGEGYLIIGIADSSDGHNRAAAAPGVPNEEAVRLAKSIRDTLGSNITPPLNIVEVRTIALRDGFCCVIVKVKGIRGWPYLVRDELGATRNIVRERAQNVPLSDEIAETRRTNLQRDRKYRLAFSSIVLTLLVVGVVAVLWLQLAPPDLEARSFVVHKVVLSPTGSGGTQGTMTGALIEVTNRSTKPFMTKTLRATVPRMKIKTRDRSSWIKNLELRSAKPVVVGNPLILPRTVSTIAFELPLAFEETRTAPSFGAEVQMDGAWTLETEEGYVVELGPPKSGGVISMKRWEELFRPIEAKLRPSFLPNPGSRPWPSNQ